MKKYLLVLLTLAGILASCAQQANKSKSNMNIIEYVSPNPEGMKEVCEFVKNCHVYYLATVEGDQPRVRPFGTFEIVEGKLFLQTGHIKNVSKQIAANPKVEICAFNGNEWIRIAATLVEDPRVETKAAMLDLNPDLKEMYSAEDDNTAVYALTKATATISSFSAAPKTIEF